MHSQDDAVMLITPCNALTVLVCYHHRLLALREAEPIVPILLCAQDNGCGMSIVPLHIDFETTTRT